ncbi:MAG: DEAD/DEAH box helicase [Burkholderiales bacterium]|nr:DEAD/DEAH box helicase [Burkholderiales bacterium]
MGEGTASFDSLGLAPALRRAVAELGHTAPTAIQAAAVPPALQGRDVIGCAHTGSGKTLAFGLPLMQRLDRWRPAWRRTYALVLVPTRELAMQVGRTLQALATHLAEPPRVAVVFGGVSVNTQMLGLRGGAEVVVATPGRLLDLVGRNAVKLDDVELLVLDEADRLLDEGFADELGRLTLLLPPQRQALFFSATFPPAVEQLAGTLALHEPVRVDAPDTADGGRPDITQRAIEVDEPKRTPLLRHLIGQADWQRVLVFVATRYATEHVADKLRRHGIPAAAFHGELSQGARTRVLNELQRGQVRVVVATDMAARGLHIADLPVVVNYDLPRSPADHTHRIGRTARAGASGLAISFITPASEPHFRLIEKRQGARVARERVEGFEPVGPGQGAEGSAAVGTGGVKGKRKSKKDKLREGKAGTPAPGQRK